MQGLAGLGKATLIHAQFIILGTEGMRAHGCGICHPDPLHLVPSRDKIQHRPEILICKNCPGRVIAL